MKWRAKYEYNVPYRSPKHCWSIVGPNGGMHLDITDRGEEYAAKFGKQYTGGISIHYRRPPKYMADHAPSQDQCWLLYAPCWHDGSSLALEWWIPFWESAPHDHDRMFQALISDAEQREWD